MPFLKGWNKKRNISAPQSLSHLHHGAHDTVTHRLQGLPPEWVQILRDNGVVGEDLVYVPPNRGLYQSGIFNMSSSSLLSNRSLQKIWRKMSGRGREGSMDGNGASSDVLQFPTLEENAASDAASDSQNTQVPLEDSLNSLVTASPELVQSPWISPQSTFDSVQTDDGIDQIVQNCGLAFRHKEFQDVNPNLFEVVDSLGHGSLGVVEEVRVSPEHSSFVRKRVQIPYHKRRQYLKIISQEAQVLQNLSHCHIVRMIGSYSEVPESGRQFYSLLMAPVGQRDLKTFLDMVGDKSSSHAADWYDDRRTWLKNWFRCLSSALAYIHSKGVRHQDIKPSNIIHRRGAIYFTDFSSASQFQIGQTTSTENPARTSAMYAAPEVIDSEQGLARHGRGTDVFALGAVFTEMLAVYRGDSIDDYHHFLVDAKNVASGRAHDDGHTPVPAPRQPFLYGRKLGEIETFFAGDAFFESCVSLMLSCDRDRRPDADDVARRIREFAPWAPNRRPCACDLDVP